MVSCDSIESDVSTAIENYRRYFDEDPERLLVRKDIYENTFEEYEGDKRTRDQKGPLWMFTIKVEPSPLDRKFILGDEDLDKKVFPDNSFEGLEREQ